MLELTLSKQQLRRLLDLVYLGNWVVNYTRDTQRIEEYDQLESYFFHLATQHGMEVVSQVEEDVCVPSQAFVEGGIHSVLAEYEGSVFFDLLAEDLALRDLEVEEITVENYGEFILRTQDYFEEFEEYGTQRLFIDWDYDL